MEHKKLIVNLTMTFKNSILRLEDNLVNFYIMFLVVK